jgi:glutaredoxin
MHEYIDVKQSRESMDEMLKWSEGRRQVPVIVEGDRVTIGYGGS